MANIHFVARSFTSKMAVVPEILKQEKSSNLLVSFESTNTIPKLKNILDNFDYSCDVIIDSGAFAVYNSGKKINIKDYSSFIKELLQLKTIHKFRFVNLDVIGDIEGTERNFKLLEGMGLDICPVIAIGDDVKKINLFADRKTVFIGGYFARKDISRNVKHQWLNQFYGYMLKNFDHSNFPRTHLLAVTKEELLSKYPAYSCDSSHWMSVFRFGYGSKEARLPGVPRRITDETMPTLKHILREHVRHFIKIETTTNKLWQSRGITYAR